MNIEEKTLVGKFVRLEPLQPSHLEGLFQAGQHHQIWRYMPMKIVDLEDMKQLIDEALNKKESGLEFPYVVIDQSTNEIVGSTRFLDISKTNRHVEIGWTWYTPKVWKTRVNTETKYLLLSYCFEELKTVRVQLKTDNRNERSKNAILRIGAKFEGVLRKVRILSDGFIRDSAYYSIIEEEWPIIKENIQNKLQ